LFSLFIIYLGLLFWPFSNFRFLEVISGRSRMYCRECSARLRGKMQRNGASLRFANPGIASETLALLLLFGGVDFGQRRRGPKSHGAIKAGCGHECSVWRKGQA